MQYIDGNIFYNKALRFKIEKPEDWTFLPQQWTWTPKARTVENTPELASQLPKEIAPFVYFYKNHEEQDFPCPTVQCICRLNNGYKLAEQMTEITEGLVKIFPESEIIEVNHDYILSGHRALYIKFKFVLYNENGQKMNCLGRSIVVIRRDFAFTIGLTGSLEEKYQCEEEFQRIIQSIRIGR